MLMLKILIIQIGIDHVGPKGMVELLRFVVCWGWAIDLYVVWLFLLSRLLRWSG